MTDDQMRSAILEIDQELYETYRQEALNGKPTEPIKPTTKETFKNRYQVCAKLTSEAYAALYAYAKAKDYSINRALREILTIYFSLRHD